MRSLKKLDGTLVGLAQRVLGKGAELDRIGEQRIAVALGLITTLAWIGTPACLPVLRDLGKHAVPRVASLAERAIEKITARIEPREHVYAPDGVGHRTEKLLNDVLDARPERRCAIVVAVDDDVDVKGSCPMNLGQHPQVVRGRPPCFHEQDIVAIRHPHGEMPKRQVGPNPTVVVAAGNAVPEGRAQGNSLRRQGGGAMRLSKSEKLLMSLVGLSAP